MAANEERFSVSELIKDHQKGFADLQISNAVRQVIAAVRQVNAAGKVTITVGIKPQKTQDGDSVLLSVDYSVTEPKPPADPSLYFIGDDNRPQKRSPRQPLALGDVALPGAEREV